MRKLHIIMPMGGEGSRFKQIGINTPKPLIEANGIKFFVRSLMSVTKDIDINNIEFTFIVRQNHIDDFHIDDEIKNIIPTAHIATVKQTTRGAVETCLLAEPFIKDDDAVLVMDCDLEWTCKEYTSKIVELLNNNSSVGGMLLSFTSDNPRYSYARVENDIVVETAEKKVISNNALTGAYYFNNGKRFIEIANRLIEENNVASINEYYVSLLYNYLIKNSEPVLLYKADVINSFGTPEELSEYEQKIKNN